MSDTTYALLIILPVILVSMSIHEMMHALTAAWLGDDTAKHEGRISLNPIRHIDPFLTVALPLLLALSGAPIFGAAKPVQVNFHKLRGGEFGGALVGAAGPLTNLVFAILAAVILRSVGVNSAITLDILYAFVAVNVGFFVFNMIPWPPLDGSRVLYAFAPRPLQEFMDSLERMGLMSIVVFMFLFFYLLAPGVQNLVITLTSGLIR